MHATQQLLTAGIAVCLLFFSGCKSEGNLVRHDYIKPAYNSMNESFDYNYLIDRYFADERRPATQTGEIPPPLTAAEKKSVRNSLIHGMIVMIDYDYSQYEVNLSNTVRATNLTMEVTSLSLTAAATFVGGEQAKATLAALATLVTGTRLAVDKNLFYESTLPILIGRMQAVRTEQKLEITKKLNSSIDEYDLRDSFSDLIRLYNSGTITSALADISKESGTKKEGAEKATNLLQGGENADAASEKK